MKDLKDLPSQERPRERLRRLGSRALSNEELLAVVIGSGTGNSGVMSVARDLLVSFGDLKNMGDATVDELSEIDGIGHIKAIQIKACFELGKRRYSNVDSVNKNENTGGQSEMTHWSVKVENSTDGGMAMDNEQARNILISLANGINPSNGEYFPPDGPYNNPEVIRALFFAVMAMQDKNDLAKPKKTYKLTKTRRPLSEKNKILFQRLKKWRLDKAKQQNLFPYMVLSNNQLYDILELPDITIESLANVKGFHDDKLELYGQEVVDIGKYGRMEINPSENEEIAADDNEV